MVAELKSELVFICNYLSNHPVRRMNDDQNPTGDCDDLEQEKHV